MEACAERAYVECLFHGWGTSHVQQALDRANALQRERAEVEKDLAWQDVQQMKTGYLITVGALEKSGEHGRDLLAMESQFKNRYGTKFNTTRLRLASSRALGGHYCLTGQHGKALEVVADGLLDYEQAEESLRQIERRNLTNHKATLLVYQAISWLSTGQHQNALNAIDAAVRYSREIGHGHSTTHALVFRTALLIMLRDDRMFDAAEEACDFAERNQFATWIAPARMMLGHCKAMRQDLYAGITAIDTAAEGNPDIYAPYGISLIVNAELRRGNQPESCVPLVHASLAIIERTHEKWFLPESLRLKGQVEARIAVDQGANGLLAGKEALEQALATAQSQRAHFWALKAATTLGELMINHGADEQGRRIIRSELVHFNTATSFYDLERARSLI